MKVRHFVSVVVLTVALSLCLPLGADELQEAYDKLMGARENYVKLVQVGASRDITEIAFQRYVAARQNFLELEKRGSLRERFRDFKNRVKEKIKGIFTDDEPTEPPPASEPDGEVQPQPVGEPEPVEPATPVEEATPALPQTGKNGVTVGQPAFVDVNESLNFRSAPWGKIIGVFHKGDKVQVVAIEGDWVKVEVNGQVGYCHGDYLNGKKPDTAVDYPTQPQEEANPSGFPERKMDNGPFPPLAYPETPRMEGGKFIRIPLFNQNNSQYGSHPSGYCGPTTMQMVMAHYGVQASRDYIALSKLSENGGATVYESGVGSYWGRMAGMAKHCGFNDTQVTFGNSLGWLRGMLDKGYPVMVGVRGSIGGAYNTGGHITVVTGYDDEGNIYINDSAGGKLRKLSQANFLEIWTASHNRVAMVIK